MADDPADFNPVARAMIERVLADHPDWDQYVTPYGPADDAEADPGSVRFSVPSPHDPSHRLEIAQRGSVFEVAYDCGAPGVRAEQQFVLGPNDMPATTSEVQAFVNRICAGRIVIVCEPLGPVMRALRGDGVARLARFSADPRREFARRKARTEIFGWTVGRSVGR